MAGIGPLRERDPTVFTGFQTVYESLLDTYLDAMALKDSMPRREISDLAERIGNQGVGPRDVIDIHIRAVSAKSENANPKRARAYTLEGRLLALEVMGNLVEFYRRGKK